MLVRLWVRRKGILPTTCSLQPPLHERKHPPLERLQKGRKQYFCHHLSLVRTFHNPAGIFPSYPEQSSRTENRLPNPLCPLPLHTFAHVILPPGVSLVLLPFPKSPPTLWKPKKDPSFPFQGLPQLWISIRNSKKKPPVSWELQCKEGHWEADLVFHQR